MRKNKGNGQDYISVSESRRINRENRRITAQMEKMRNRKHVDEREYTAHMRDENNVVEFDNVHTYFFTDIGTVKAVNGISFEVPRGKTVGVVGESGCGKSVTSLSLMQLVQRPQGQTVEGEIRLQTKRGTFDVVKMPTDKMQYIRGNVVSMIFQEPMTSLNPIFRVGHQIDEVIRLHQPELGSREVKEALHRIAGYGGHCQSRGRLPVLSARAFGRHAAARDDCDGAFVQPAPDHRR